METSGICNARASLLSRRTITVAAPWLTMAGSAQATAGYRMALRFNLYHFAEENDLMKTTLGSILVSLAMSTVAMAQATGSDPCEQAGPRGSRTRLS